MEDIQYKKDMVENIKVILLKELIFFLKMFHEKFWNVKFVLKYSGSS